MSARKQKWGYKGTETVITGLVNWLSKNGYYTSGKWDEFYDKACKIICQYGDEFHIKRQGNPRTAADYVAKAIDREKKFQHFTKWVKENIKP